MFGERLKEDYIYFVVETGLGYIPCERVKFLFFHWIKIVGEPQETSAKAWNKIQEYDCGD